ncbi:MAG: glycosyltransferase family 2 protein [Thermoanaerobaculia bacterium]
MAPTDAKSGAHSSSVSIGLPVYNGEAYLEEALGSIAAQTFTDYEVIISDNASTDGTQDICRSHAAKDRRIRYYRNPTNIGGDRNYYRCFELSSGDYFLGMAHDDRLHPDYLRKVLEVLDADPSVVFCHSRAYQMDGTGAVVGAYDARPFSESPRPHERFRDAIGLRPVIACLGVIRPSVLRQMPPLLAYPGSDAYWQAEFALRGKLVEVPEVLFYRMVYPGSGGRIPLHQRIRWSDPAKAGTVIFPSWRRPAEYGRSVLRSPLTLSERLLCFREIARYVRRRGGRRPLLRDIKAAAKTLLSRSRPGFWLLASWSRVRKH